MNEKEIMEQKQHKPLDLDEADRLEEKFLKKLTDLLNHHGYDTHCNTADNILAAYVIDCLDTLACVEAAKHEKEEAKVADDSN